MCCEEILALAHKSVLVKGSYVCMRSYIIAQGSRTFPKTIVSFQLLKNSITCASMEDTLLKVYIVYFIFCVRTYEQAYCF